MRRVLPVGDWRQNQCRSVRRRSLVNTRYLLTLLLATLTLCTSTNCGENSITEPQPETIISRQDAENIFSLSRSEWDAYAKAMVHPTGWTVALSDLDTGTSVMAYDPKSGFGLSIQPLYPEIQGPPLMLIVGSYYPPGTFTEFTEQLRGDIEEAAQTDLGEKYSVSARLERIAPFGTELELIELTITSATE